MRKLILPVLLSSVLSAQAHDPKSWNTYGGWGLGASNHVLHLEAGLLIGGVAYGVASALGYGDPKSTNWLKRNTTPWQHGVAWAVTAGVWKERQDGRHVGVRGSWPDLAWTAAGGVVICTSLKLFSKPPAEAYAMAPKLEPEAPRQVGPCCPDDSE